MINPIPGDTVYVEYVSSAVDIGRSCGELKRLVVAQFKFTANAQIQAVIRGQTALVQGSELNPEFLAVGNHVVG